MGGIHSDETLCSSTGCHFGLETLVELTDEDQNQTQAKARDREAKPHTPDILAVCNIIKCQIRQMPICSLRETAGV